MTRRITIHNPLASLSKNAAVKGYLIPSPATVLLVRENLPADYLTVSGRNGHATGRPQMENKLFLFSFLFYFIYIVSAAVP
jgi:hypothetical protein